VEGYLFDTNHVSALFNKKSSILAKLKLLAPNTQIRACTITLGEIEAGHGMTKTTNQRRRDEYTAFVNETFFPNALSISTSTGRYYAKIIERIWNKHPKPTQLSTERHLVDLGVDINDVWIAAVAWEHGLALVTNDKMFCIKEVITKEEVEFENWL